MSPRWRYYFLGYLMALPHTLVGLFVFVVFYHARSWKWHQGVLTCVADGGVIWGHPNAQTQGWAQVFDSEKSRDSAALRVHETCHVVQAFLLGPVYPVLYGLTFLVAYLKADFPSDWRPAYREIPFEEQAYARQAKYTTTPYPAWGA